MTSGFPVLGLAGDLKHVIDRALLAAAMGIATIIAWPAAHADTSPTLLVLGDSLSAAYGIEQEEGWVHLLNERLDGEARVVNASISGETTAGGAERLPDLLGQHEPQLVLLELGGNDGLRGLPPQQMHSNLAGMIEASQAADAEVLLLGIDIPPNYGQAYRDAFTGVYHDLAEEYDIALVPFLLDGVALEQGMMQSDGIHPTAAGQPVILDNVWPELERWLEQRGATLASGSAQ